VAFTFPLFLAVREVRMYLLEKRSMSLNLEQEFPLDMFPEIICSFIQHGLMITATIHSF